MNNKHENNDIKEAKEKRRAQALRENLKRRKLQQKKPKPTEQILEETPLNNKLSR
jgi:hypothetical protein